MSRWTKPVPQARHYVSRAKSFLIRQRLVVQLSPVFIDQQNLCTNPIFIVGVQRSGTTLLRRILNTHPEIACPPESYFMAHFAALLEDEAARRGLKGIGLAEEELPAEVGRWAARFHEGYRTASGKSRWADKTPQYLTILEPLHAMYAPGAKFVCIKRHPFDITTSIHQLGWDFDETDSDPLRARATYVRNRIADAVNFSAAHPADCQWIRYEDLASEPTPVLKELCAFLDEQFHPQMLEYWRGQHNVGLEDSFATASRGFSPSSDNWRSLSKKDVDTLRDVLGETATELGYSVD
jgi:Sulfotransferase family